MKRASYILMAVALMAVSCNKQEAKPEDVLLEKIENMYQSGQYQTALDSIVRLRDQYPMAIEARKRCLVLWNEATLKLTQIDIGKTDIELESVKQRIATERNLYNANMLRVRRDSLQARYEALCAIAHKIQDKKKNDYSVGK